MNAVSVQNVSFSYPNALNAAVDDASFSLEENSYTVLAGINGSGKSTLSRIIAGLLEADKGSVSIKESLKTGIVFQSPKDQIICGTVGRDTSFGPKNQGFSDSETELLAIENLTAVGMLDHAPRKSMSLSLGQTQKVALAGILAMNPDILILDESVAMLDSFSREDIFNFLDILHEKGKTILHVTHDKDALMRAENVVLMEKGKVLWQGSRTDFLSGSGQKFYKNIFGVPLNEIFENGSKNQCSGQNSGQKTPEKTSRNALQKTSQDEPEISLAVENLSFSYSYNPEKAGSHKPNDKINPILDDVSFFLKKGSLTSITGASGSGKSTLLEILSGLLQFENGNQISKIYAESRPVLAQQNSDAALFETFASDDVAFGAINRGKKGKELLETVKSSMEKVGLPFETFASRQTNALSGGEKRRLALAGIIALGSEIILFDEPTAGLDGISRTKTLKMMKNLSLEGKTVLFSTHHSDEADFADEHLHLENGKLVGTCAEKPETIEEKLKNQKTRLSAQNSMEGASLLKGLQAFSNSSSLQDRNLFSGRKQSVTEKLPAVLKYILFLGMFVSSMVFRPLWLCGIFVAASFAYALLSFCPLKRLLSAMIKIIPLLLFFCIIEIVFVPVSEGERIFVDYRFFSISLEKIFLCLRVLFHTESALCCIFAFVSSTDENDIIDGFEKLLFPLKIIRVPTKYLVLLMEIIFRFIPLLVEEAICIMKTQLVRGGLGKAKGVFGKIKAAVPLVVPLVIQTIKRAEILADALTARGFK